MKLIMTTVSILASAPLFAPRTARADDAASQDIYSYAWHDPQMQTDIGVSAILGGGVTGFTDKTMRDTMNSSVGGLWDLRVTLGSHIPLALDVSYLGTAAKITSLIGAQQTTLVGSTAEAALRYNILPHYAWNPYAFAGVGWQRYDVTGSGFTLSDTGVRSSDNSVVFPMGAGIGYRDRGLVLDLRGTFRANTNANLVLDKGSTSSYAPMNSWEASAAAGYEF